MKYFFSYDDVGKTIINKKTKKEFVVIDDNNSNMYSILLKSVNSDRRFLVSINDYMGNYKEKEVKND